MSNNLPSSLASEGEVEAEVHNWYDQCGNSPDWASEETVAAGSTGWTAAFKYNAIIFLILVILTVLELCCILIPGIPPNLIFAANGCIVCLGTPLLAGPILSAVRANSDLGTACTLKDGTYTYLADTNTPTNLDGHHTFATDGALLRLLMIVQFVFFCPMQCCAICGGVTGYTICNVAKLNDEFNRV